MKEKTKLNVLLAVTDSLYTYYNGMIVDYSKFFKSAQGAFIGSRSTYEANEGTIDEPSKRSNALVQTTVDEKFDWFINNSKLYIDALFSQEKTNSYGVAKAELVINGESWGELSSLELLRLKSIISSGQIEVMIQTIPVRSDSIEWFDSSNEMYSGRDIKETPLISGVNITTTKEDYILNDPNNAVGRTPQVAQKTTIVELGKTTIQRFSGQWSQRQKAEALRRRSDLLTAITKALKECNDVEVVKSDITSQKIFGYLFNR